MGLFRTYLAISVMLWHLLTPSGLPFPFVTGICAVLFFYMISGFLMAMVINEKYWAPEGRWAWRFYLARMLRIFPLYFLVLIATLAIYPAFGLPSIFNVTGLTVWQWGVVLVSNATLLGLDYLNYFGFGHGNDRIVDIAWTLGVELQFYIVAPFIVTRSLRWCIVILIGLLALRVGIVWRFNSSLNWSYYFAPSVWCFFLMGVVGYKISELINDQYKLRFGLASIILLVPLSILANPHSNDRVDSPALWALYAAVALAIPFIFAFSKTSKLYDWVDQKIGDLCYPLYLIHLLVMWPVIAAVGHRMLPFIYTMRVGAGVIIGTTFLLSILFVFIESKATGTARRSIVTVSRGAVS